MQVRTSSKYSQRVSRFFRSLPTCRRARRRREVILSSLSRSGADMSSSCVPQMAPCCAAHARVRALEGSSRCSLCLSFDYFSLVGLCADSESSPLHGRPTQCSGWPHGQAGCRHGIHWTSLRRELSGLSSRLKTTVRWRREGADTFASLRRDGPLISSSLAWSSMLSATI
jgi:hypothetical protein